MEQVAPKLQCTLNFNIYWVNNHHLTKTIIEAPYWHQEVLIWETRNTMVLRWEILTTLLSMISWWALAVHRWFSNLQSNFSSQEECLIGSSGILCPTRRIHSQLTTLMIWVMNKTIWTICIKLMQIHKVWEILWWLHSSCRTPMLNLITDELFNCLVLFQGVF